MQPLGSLHIFESAGCTIQSVISTVSYTFKSGRKRVYFTQDDEDKFNNSLSHDARILFNFSEYPFIQGESNGFQTFATIVYRSHAATDIPSKVHPRV